MRFVCTADWHIRTTPPRIRKDDYQQALLRKISQILDIAEENAADVLVAGDLFDRPSCSYSMLNALIGLFSGTQNYVHAIPGQHDLHFHNPDLANTPFGTLVAAKSILYKEDWLVGVGWGEEIPDEEAEVLLIHRPITPENPPFFMEDAVSAKEFVERYGKQFPLIVSGDYHVRHHLITEDTILVNPGPIMRASKDKMDYRPSVYLVDTESREVETIYLDVEKDVWNEDALKQDEKKELSEELKALIEKTGEGIVFGRFWDVVEDVLKAAESPKEVIDVIKEIQETIDEQ